jgi:hypothetical protein
MMTRHLQLTFLLLLLVTVPAVSHAQQPWTGIIAPSRAPVGGWVAGVPGGIPNRTTICATVAPYGTSSSPASASTINAAIAACPSGEVVSLGAGTFYLSDQIAWNGTSNVTLRGQGANLTFIESYSGFVGCSGFWTSVDMCGAQFAGSGGEQNVCDFTGASTTPTVTTGTYTQGATYIQVSNCGTTTPALGSGSNLKIGNLIILDQLNETSDTGQIFNCATDSVCAYADAGGDQREDGPCGSWQGTWNATTNYTIGQGVLYSGTAYVATANNTNSTPAYQSTTPWYTCFRSQQQAMLVTSISGSGPYVVGLSQPLYMPNWRTGQLPQAWYATTNIYGDGLENLSIDDTNSKAGSTVLLSVCEGCWVKGIRSTNAARSHVGMFFTGNDVVRDSYFYQNKTGGSVSYGVEFNGAWNSLVENNIFQQVTDSDPSCTGACEGNVVDYNFDVYNTYSGQNVFQDGFYQHAAGDALNLWEGNIGNGFIADGVHGTHHFETVFRNFLVGQQAAGCGAAPCTEYTIPFELWAGSRYFNAIGNVMGWGNYYNTYKCTATSAASCLNQGTTMIALGYTHGQQAMTNPATSYQFCSSPSCSSLVNWDVQTLAYLMLWGNYDTLNAAVQWNSAEVPSSVSPYGNAVPSSHTLPPSFYYSSQPSWWTSGIPWPPIGPDVTNGNIGSVAGGTYDAFGTHALGTSTSQNGGGTFTANADGGHANTNPAMNCALNVMGMPVDGSGSVLSFNAATCYYGGPTQPPASQGPVAPTGVNAAVQP